jgi:very-short-patch-repair endonuclease
MEKCEPESQSGTESITRLRLRAAGFTVVVQPVILGIGRVDMRMGRLLIGCDSQSHHTSLDNYRNDRRRDRKALPDRWLTMRITYDDVLYGWEDVLADIRSITRTDRHRIRRRIVPVAGDEGLCALGDRVGGMKVVGSAAE